MISHLNKNNKPNIVDITKKKITKRSALAQGVIKFSKVIFKKIEKMESKKGEVANIAIIAGVMAAKKTSDLIPLCHNINLDNVDIDIQVNKKNYSLTVNAKVDARDKTGVEMEALTAVSVTCLTIYDMFKSLDKSIEIINIKLLSKSGGKSDFLNK